MDQHGCQIFYISEVLSVVLENIADDKRSMVALAYTSKAISDTALDYLWADLSSFSPLVPLLPKSVQEIWDLRCNPATIPSLIECPPLEQWKHFDAYARRVRRIRPGDDYLDRALYQRLVSIRTGIDLFPRLTSLRCYLFNSLVPGMKLFPPSLRSLSLYPEYALVLDGRAELALRQAAQDAPLLEELYIVGIYRQCPDIDFGPLVFKKLRTVCLIASMLRPADLSSFSHLLSCAPISNLGISLRSSSDGFPHPSETASATFSRVEKLSICDGPRRAADIVSRICSPHLNSVMIEHRDRFASLSEYARFFGLLAHKSVRALEVKMGRIYVNTRNEYVRGFLDTLAPLVDAGLVRLRIEMSLYGAWKIEEDVKKRMRPEAWPTLVFFEFVLTEASTLPFAHLDDAGP